MSNETKNPRGAVTPPAVIQAGVAALLEREGETGACRELKLSRLAVTKLAYGRPVLRGTVALAALGLGIEIDGAYRG